jgi:hypothetical protein
VRRVLAPVLAILLAGTGAACGDDEPTRVYVFGDSLVAQATPYLEDLLRERGFAPNVNSVPGSATCDWFGNFERVRDGFDPDVVVMAFSGNALGPCMRAEDGSALSSEEYVAKYRRDSERAIEAFDDDTPFYVVGTPVNAEGEDRVYRVYEDLPARFDNVEFVDGGEYVTPGGRFAMTLPCLEDEPCTGPVVDGERHNVVRAPDRAHFCEAEGAAGRCPGYSSGAYRFALAIAEAVEGEAS